MYYSKAAISIIKRHESLSLRAYAATTYEAHKGIYTIGWGHTHGVKRGDSITIEEANRFLIEDIKDSENIVRQYVPNSELLSQEQYDVLVSLAFNLGHKIFKNRDGSKTGILNAIEKEDHEQVVLEIPRWKYQGGKILPGLVLRRHAEMIHYCIGLEKNEC
jgi:lysozyme